ncbi:hypothetical protein YC2023_041806 [Brassica napus]
MLPVLYYIGKGSESNIGWFIEKSVQLHKAPKLEMLIVRLCPSSPVDVDLGMCVENAQLIAAGNQEWQNALWKLDGSTKNMTGWAI